jgi:hypothetical protein
MASERSSSFVFLFCFESSFITRLVHSESSMKPPPRNQNPVRYLEGVNCGTLEVELVDDALAEDCRDQVWLRNVSKSYTTVDRAEGFPLAHDVW